MNITLNERERCMRLKSDLPQKFWVDTVNTDAFLINKDSSAPFENFIPKEKWTDEEVNLSHLCIYGCVAYVHVYSTSRRKLEVCQVYVH